jgi:hypothetical protein
MLLPFFLIPACYSFSVVKNKTTEQDEQEERGAVKNSS